MARNEVLNAGVICSAGEHGYYRVEGWYRLVDGRMQSELYDQLSWAECSNVIDAFMGTHRPGWEAGYGWSQPPLLAD